VNLIAEQLRGGDRPARQKTAIAIFALMIGALQLARAVADKSLSDQILALRVFATARASAPPTRRLL